MASQLKRVCKRISDVCNSCERNQSPSGSRRTFHRDVEPEEFQYASSHCLSSYYSVFVVRLAIMVRWIFLLLETRKKRDHYPGLVAVFRISVLDPFSRQHKKLVWLTVSKASFLQFIWRSFHFLENFKNMFIFSETFCLITNAQASVLSIYIVVLPMASCRWCWQFWLDS